MSKVLALLSQFSDRDTLLDMKPDSLHAHIAAALDGAPESREDYLLAVEAVYGLSNFDERKPFVFSEGVAVIPVTGVLLNRYNWASSYATGYDAIRVQLDAALKDPEVKGIVYDHNSPGGSAQGCFELAAEIRAGNKIKPSIAVVNANSMSGSYALAAAAGKIVAIQSAQVGSVGVYKQHMDYSKALEKAGVKNTFVIAGERKVDGNPYEPLTSDVKKEMQASVDATYDQFVGLVAKYRGIDEKVVRDTEARVYVAADAKELGLIDAIAAPGAAVSAFVEKLAGAKNSFTLGVNAMSTTPEQPVAAPAPEAVAATARSEERSRIAAIINSDEAKGREALASHLAMDTDTSVDAAKKILTAAPVAKAETPAATPTTAPTAFEQAMANGNPEVTPAAPVVEESVSARMLKNHQAASGYKIN